MKATILIGDVIEQLRTLPSESVHCVVTSPPYWGLRDYGVVGQIGLEATPQEFITNMVDVFREVRRVLRSDGTCWVNMGDSYNAGTSAKRPAPKTGVDVGGWLDSEIDGGARVNAPGLKSKDLMGMPWRLAFALQDDGWWLRQDIIWSKPNPMPESVTDRCTKAHEYIFLLTKSARYFYDAEAIKEKVSPATNPRRARAQTSEARLDGVPGQSPHSMHGIRLPDTYKGSLPGRKDGPGQDRRSSNDRKLALPGSGTKNNSSFDEAMAVMPSMRNKRSVWEIATEPFPEAHFATFPTKLVEPCILAGTSEKGVCDNCWTPWVRETELVDTGKKQKMADGWDTGDGGHGTVHRGGREAEETGVAIMTAKTVGWKLGCSCETADAIPSTVLDPFSGSGTTGLVALANRCNYIGIELNPEYAAMSQRRIDALLQQEVLVFA